MKFDQVIVRPDELVEQFTSLKFRTLLAKAARTTMRTGYETSLALYQNARTRNYEWEDVRVGGTDCAQRTDDIDLSFGRDENHFRVFDLHFHPGTGRYASRPSVGDLETLNAEGNPFETRPILGIGFVDRYRAGHVSLFQRTFTGRLQHEDGIVEQVLETYDRAIASQEPNDTGDILRTLEIPGVLKTGLVRFADTRGDHAMATILNPDELPRFAYTLDAHGEAWSAFYDRFWTGQKIS